MTCIPLQLSVLTTQQLPQVLELDRACFGGLWTKDGYQREIDSPNSTLLVLPSPTIADALIGLGCSWAILEEAHITILAVHPDYQRQGLGQLLLVGLLRDAYQRQLERATLEVGESNAVAIALYKKFGFQVAGRRKGYYQTTGEDALIMWRKDIQDASFLTQLQIWERAVGDRLCAHHWQWQSPYQP